MPVILACSLHAAELPFRGTFQHAASARQSSSSLFLELRLDDGTTGWGEALPRPYVTGESRDDACQLLATKVLPRLLGRAFDDFAAVTAFLSACDGCAPAAWVDPAVPQSAAWCAVDLALLDAFGRRCGHAPFGPPGAAPAPTLRYSGVLSTGRSLKRRLEPLAWRLLGFRSLKLKVDATTRPADLARVRRLAGPTADLRVDVNMGWNLQQALTLMPAFARLGIRSFEQPLPADDLDGAAHLVRETGLDVMADESLNTAASLRVLLERRACTAINARISKCGGLIATLARCREALAAGLWVQLGCQVGESSLLSAAHLQLAAAVPELRHAEGCFGRLLLAADPARPTLQLHRGGRPPSLPPAPGLGVSIDPNLLAHHRVAHWHLGPPHDQHRSCPSSPRHPDR